MMTRSSSSKAKRDDKPSESTGSRTSPGSKAFRGLSLVMVVTAVQKIITFSLNSMLVRRTHPGIFGVAAVQLELLLSTLLFFSREGVRLALLRETASGSGVEKRQQFINLSWAPATLLAIASFVFCLFWVIEHTKKETSLSAYFHFEDMSITVMLLYCLGALFESCGEPWTNMYANNMSFAPKLAAETLGLCVRSIITFVSLVYFEYGVLGFGFAQLGYGIAHLVVVMAYSGSINDDHGEALTFTDYLPGRKVSAGVAVPFVDMAPVSFAMQATASSLLKHVLTEADKITLSLTRSNEEQGVFAVANNYASLIARLAFAPIEETARAAFSKYAQTLQGDTTKREKSASLAELIAFLTRLLQAVTAFGTVLVVFGPHYIRLAVTLFLAPQWRREETVHTLVAFCVYIFMLGLNGVSEAFLYSLSDGFKNINYTLGVSTAVYIATNVALLKHFPTLGTAGIVVSGSVAYLARVTANFYNIKQFYVAHGLDIAPTVAALVPNIWLLTSLAVAFAVCRESSTRFAASDKEIYAAVVHIAVGGLSFLVVAGVAFLSGREQLSDMLKFIVTKKDKKD